MKLLKNENINNIFFLDIETVPKWENLEDAPADVQKEWIYKFKFADAAPKKPDPKNDNSKQEFIQKKYFDYFRELWTAKAGLFPEFSKVVCISAGYMNGANFKIKSWSHKNEAELLKSFATDLNSFFSYNKYLKLCAHYGKKFDFPFLAKRLLIHRQKLPTLLDNYGIKPWENINLDTWEIWGGGTLGSIAIAFGIPSPKDDIEGSDVARVYYSGDIDRIVKYCEKDVFTLLNVFKAMRAEEALDWEAVQITI